MKITDTQRWRTELELSEKFREDEFGVLNETKKLKAGENIEYYERGFSDRLVPQHEDWLSTLNIVDAITSIIVPSLYFRNPRTVVVPKKVSSEDTAPIVGKTIDHYRKQLGVEEVNQKVIWDAYVLGYGVYKVGYATKFGVDIRDEEREKEKKKRTFADKALEAIGLKEKKKESPVHPEQDYRIVAENPFIEYVNPFDFLLDPRSTSINDAMWVAQSFRKSVKDMKANPKYKNTSLLKGMEPEVRTLEWTKISESEQEEFQTVNLWEIHYRSQNKMYLLVISKDGSDEWREHYHEESIYQLGEWQFDMLTFKKHGHSLYPRSDITKIKNLQDRITTTVDAILEQVDKFVPKLAYVSGDLTDQGKNALENGDIGALVETNKNPNEVFKELGFTQLKADLQALIDQIINLISIQTGITRAQLTGISDANTATEATIEQGGQNLRISDMSGQVQRLVNRQSRKFWKVIRQFVTLEDLELINGVKGVDQNTGLPKYDWLLIDELRSQKIQEGDYDFDIEVGSTEKINLAVVRKAFENMFNILARTDVLVAMQQQGDKVVLSEILRRYVDLFPELGIDAGKFIQKIDQNTQGLIPEIPPEARGGTTSGSASNALQAQLGEPAPSLPEIQQGGAQL